MQYQWRMFQGFTLLIHSLFNMFENQPNQKQPNNPNPSGPLPQNNAPANLPTQPPGQFNQQPPKPSQFQPRQPAAQPQGQGASLPNEPEDILADVDQDQGTSAQTPAQPVQDFVTQIPPAIPTPEAPQAKEPFFRRVSKPLGIVLALLVIGSAVAVGGYFGYQHFFANQPLIPDQDVGPALNQNSDQTNQPQLNINQGGNVSNVNTNVNQPVNTNTNTNVEPPKPLDSDLDGLSDEDEELYGTDPQKVDTDDDGLTDRDEVKVFETDPNNSDTDGDSYGDGDEVRAGYDPKGPGKLFRL